MRNKNLTRSKRPDFTSPRPDFRVPPIFPPGYLRFFGLLALPLMLAASPVTRAQSTPAYADVAPIFQKSCVMCHSGQAAPLGLRLDTLEAILEGSSRGAVVKAGAPGESELLRRIKGSSQPRMPMTGPPFLSDDEVGAIERWIEAGMQAGEPVGETPAAAAATQRPGVGEKVTYLHVAPIFATRCAKCHTENGLMGPAPEGFRLTSYESTLAAGDRVRVVPGNPGASELLRRVRGQARPPMPMDGPPYLDPDEIQLIEDWISQGAAYAEGAAAAVPAGARLRLHGRLSSATRLDDLDLVIGSGTRIDKNPRRGDYVQVRGRLDAAGRVIVERLRRRKK